MNNTLYIMEIFVQFVGVCDGKRRKNMLYSKIEKQINYAFDHISNSTTKDIVINLATIALAAFDNGPYRIGQTVKIINLVDENKKYLNGTIGKIIDVYIEIDKQRNITYQYIVYSKKYNSENFIVKAKNLEKTEEKRYVIEGFCVCDISLPKTLFSKTLFYIKKDGESFIATQSPRNATIFIEDEISEISLSYMPLIENITWRFRELQES